MKFLLLPVLLWTLATSQIFAQKSLPPSVEDYAVNWSYSVKQMLEAAGYEVPGPTANFDLVLQNRNRDEELQLDSTVTYFGYNTAADSTPLFKVVYTYPQPDEQVIEEYFFENGQWSSLTRTTLTTDDLGRMIKTFAEDYDAELQAYIPNSQILFYPHGDTDLADSFFVYGWAFELHDLHRVFAVWNVYDAADKLQESTSSLEIFEVPVILIDRYTYTPEGDVSLVESFFVDGEEILPASRDEYFYTDHLLSSVTSLVSNGPQGFLAESKVTYAYTASGKQETIMYYEYDLEKNDWKLIMVEAFAYDEEDRLINKEVVKDKEGIWERHLTSYTYVTGEYTATKSEHSYDNNAEAWIVEDKTFYYYNELVSGVDDEPVEKALFLYPNPTAGTVQVTLPGSSTLYVYTLSEQLVYKAQLQAGEKAIDLSRLPAGLYQVRALNGKEYYSGKLVIQ